jgi:hypothetical protein
MRVAHIRKRTQRFSRQIQDLERGRGRRRVHGRARVRGGLASVGGLRWVGHVRTTASHHYQITSRRSSHTASRH